MDNKIKHNLYEILENIKKFNVDKNWILKNIDKFDLTMDYFDDNQNFPNPLFFIILNNKCQNLGFSKEDILSILDKFDLKQKNKDGRNILMYIIYYNDYSNLGFTKKDIVSILDKFDLNLVSNSGENVLMYIIKSFYEFKISKFNKKDILSILNRFKLNQRDNLGNNVLMLIIVYDLGFTGEEILSILDKFDLNQKNIIGRGVYDFFKKEYGEYLSILISKLDIEMTDKNNKNILISELNNGLFFESEELVKKILNTKNKDIIDCVYQHINQITWKQKDLLFFLKKNELSFNKKSFDAI